MIVRKSPQQKLPLKVEKKFFPRLNLSRKGD